MTKANIIWRNTEKMIQEIMDSGLTLLCLYYKVCYWSYVSFQLVRDRPTWHVGRWQRSCAGRAGAGRGASWGRWRPSDAWQVGRGVRGEGRLSRVALLTLAARHTWRAHARTQGALSTCGQVIDGPWQVLKTHTGRAKAESTDNKNKPKKKKVQLQKNQLQYSIFYI